MVITDSGVLVSEVGIRDRAGSYGSIASAHSIVSTQGNRSFDMRLKLVNSKHTGASLSPITYRRQQSHIQVVTISPYLYNNIIHTVALILQTPLSRIENVIPVKPTTSSWKLLHSMVSELQSGISSVVYRGANTLITATKGHVSRWS